jgi:hypothetical protein
MPEQPHNLKSIPVGRALPHVAAVVCLLVCLFCIWSAARIGLSRLFADYASASLVLPAADEAVRFSPTDPEGHYARAIVLAETGQHSEAAKAFTRAVALRPSDYFLWFELGRSLDQMDDPAGALDAFREATRLAPHYAQPRWQIGNLLLRTRPPDEAFAELRRAALSDPALFPALIDLLWGVSGGDARAVEQAVGAETPGQRLQLARFFAKRGSADAAVRMFREAGHGGEVSDQNRRAIVSDLLGRKRFEEAYEVWSSGGAESAGAARLPSRGAAMIDGGFEGDVLLDEVGFGWQIKSNAQTVRVSLDADAPRTDSRSLRVDFNGVSSPALKIVSQIVLVEPGTRYRLSFAGRTQSLSTGGPPVIDVVDLSGESRALARSKPLPPGASQWQDYTLEFETPAASTAVLIILQRQNCPGQKCPVFGSVWFDDFALTKLSG